MEDGALLLQLNAYEMLHNECTHSRASTHLCTQWVQLRMHLIKLKALIAA